jgi:hypothetical protein
VPGTRVAALLFFSHALQDDAALLELALDPRVMLGDEMREEVL